MSPAALVAFHCVRQRFSVFISGCLTASDRNAPDAGRGDGTAERASYIANPEHRKRNHGFAQNSHLTFAIACLHFSQSYARTSYSTPQTSSLSPRSSCPNFVTLARAKAGQLTASREIRPYCQKSDSVVFGWGPLRRVFRDKIPNSGAQTDRLKST